MARMLVFYPEAFYRPLFQTDLDEDIEGWRQLRLPMPPSGAARDSRDALRLVASMTGREWRKARRRMQRDWEQQLAEAAERRKAEPPPAPPTGHRFYSSELEGRPDLYIKGRTR